MNIFVKRGCSSCDNQIRRPYSQAERQQDVLIRTKQYQYSGEIVAKLGKMVDLPDSSFKPTDHTVLHIVRRHRQISDRRIANAQMCERILGFRAASPVMLVVTADPRLSPFSSSGPQL